MLPARPAPDNADSQFLRGVTTQTAHVSTGVRRHFHAVRLAGHHRGWHAGPGQDPRPNGSTKLRAAALILRKLSTYNILRARRHHRSIQTDGLAAAGPLLGERLRSGPGHLDLVIVKLGDHGTRIVRSSRAIRSKSESKVMSSAPASMVAAAIQISLTGIGVPAARSATKISP